MIKSALDAKGFIKLKLKPSLKVGFDGDEINKKIDEIIDGLISKKIKHLYIIGLINYLEKCPAILKAYLNCSKDCLAVSLTYDVNKPNVYHLKSFVTTLCTINC